MYLCGVDIVSIRRFSFLVERYGERFLNRVFAGDELNYCAGKRFIVECLAGKFAAKEAIIKAMNLSGVALKDIVILNKEKRPTAFIKGEMQKELDISISHDRDYAVAVCIYRRCSDG
ncbi:MAG: holo-ACP synthase [candidate division WOR-3 bacterium]